MKALTPEDLECLNLWPEGTVGHRKEKALHQTLLALCDEHGYGMLGQLMGQIETIWRDPQAKETFEQRKQKHFAFMRWCSVEAYGKPDEPNP